MRLTNSNTCTHDEKESPILTLILTAILTSCREDPDATVYYGEVNKLAYTSYTEQFQYIWKNVSTGYVFWDIETVDWDEVYERCLPRVQEFDARVKTQGGVSTNELKELYTSVFGPLRDHHLSLTVQNLHPLANEESRFTVSPGKISYLARPDHIEASIGAQRDSMTVFIKDRLQQTYAASAMAKIADYKYVEYFAHYSTTDSTKLSICYVLFQLPDGRYIPYLWQSRAMLTPTLKCLGKTDDEGKAAAAINTYFTKIATLPREQIAGIILDNRCNLGGYQDDLDYLLGSFLNEEVTISQTRYKEGPGRLEYSAWADYKQKPVERYHRDITAENIPYVMLCDQASASMGELEEILIAPWLPTVHTIGERTYGATCALQPSLVDLAYSGAFGDEQNTNGHYLYTTTFEAIVGGKCYETEGYTPQQLVVRKDYDGSFAAALNAALNYCRDY